MDPTRLGTIARRGFPGHPHDARYHQEDTQHVGKRHPFVQEHDRECHRDETGTCHQGGGSARAHSSDPGVLAHATEQSGGQPSSDEDGDGEQRKLVQRAGIRTVDGDGDRDDDDRLTADGDKDDIGEVTLVRSDSDEEAVRGSQNRTYESECNAE